MFQLSKGKLDVLAITASLYENIGTTDIFSSAIFYFFLDGSENHISVIGFGTDVPLSLWSRDVHYSHGLFPEHRLFRCACIPRIRFSRRDEDQPLQLVYFRPVG